MKPGFITRRAGDRAIGEALMIWADSPGGAIAALAEALRGNGPFLALENGPSGAWAVQNALVDLRCLIARLRERANDGEPLARRLRQLAALGDDLVMQIYDRFASLLDAFVG